MRCHAVLSTLDLWAARRCSFNVVCWAVYLALPLPVLLIPGCLLVSCLLAHSPSCYCNALSIRLHVFSLTPSIVSSKGHHVPST
jgi:hypothetical protein